jgi:DNA-binding NarL/FixJ family response regulator
MNRHENDHPCTVLVADDAPELRLLYSIALGQDPDFKVVGQACCGEDAISLARQLHPDIVLLDVSMPGIGGIAALRTIKADSHDTSVFMLSGFSHDWLETDPMELGASGVLSKAQSMDQIISSLKRHQSAHALRR